MLEVFDHLDRQWEYSHAAAAVLDFAALISLVAASLSAAN
jgi:hypothetical protein